MNIAFSNILEKGLLLGWEYYPALDKDDQKEIKVYLILVCLHFKWING
tara:strand:- start:448 stop:591 length:144 start_codon:yes stop_codon:yes gene_type:complete